MNESSQTTRHVYHVVVRYTYRGALRRATYSYAADSGSQAEASATAAFQQEHVPGARITSVAWSTLISRGA